MFSYYDSQTANMDRLEQNPPSGGELIARFLKNNGVKFIYTLCGGHISPILVGCEKQGIRVVDVRHEATAVFAADATARLTGIPGVAAVTAGPGVTNTITAIENASLAESPLIVLGGATATILRGRGALQDIDQISLMKPITKWAKRVTRVRDILPALGKAFEVSLSGVPGPVFLEFPLDVLYPKKVVTDWYFANAPRSSTLMAKITHFYLRRHISRLFSVDSSDLVEPSIKIKIPKPKRSVVSKTRELIEHSEKPLLLISSQALLQPQKAERLASLVKKLGIPTYLSGMARGLLGRSHPLHVRHKRRNALKEADLIILAGIPVDFRLNYGFSFNRHAKIIAVNRSKQTLSKNVSPTIKAHSDVYEFFNLLLEEWEPNPEKWVEWLRTLKLRDSQRDQEIINMSMERTEYINPLSLLLEIENNIGTDGVLIGDGGDFVASAAYTIHPRKPLGWLDPGVFGTLGSGGGFALAAKLINPEAEVWLFYGDGSVGYTLTEWETFARHRIGVIGIIGNDAGWTQIERDQTVLLGSDVATRLAHTDYDKAAIGLGAYGTRVSSETEIQEALRKAKSHAMNNKPFLINALIGKTEFRKGSISV